MIYRSGVFSKREGLSDNQFREHWINVHGALARKMPGLRSYRQNHIVERLYEARGMAHHAIDGISQLKFDDVAAMERAEISPEYAACKTDIPKFQGAITILVLEREEIVRRANTPLAQKTAKLLWVSLARGDVNGAELRGRWMTDAAVKINWIGKSSGFTQNFVSDRAHPVQAGVPQGDIAAEALSELWFEDVASLKAWVASPAGHGIIYEDSMLTPIGVYLIEEIRIV